MTQSIESHLRETHSVKSLADVGLGEIRRPPYLFDDFLLRRTLIMVSAEPFTGKTMLTLSMALCLDAGRPLFGKIKPIEKRKVLYIGQDAATWDYAEQTRKLLVGLGLADGTVEALDTEAIFNQGLDILDSKFYDFLSLWRDEIGLDVLILDTLASMHSADENSNREMGFVMQVLKRCRDRLGLTVIFTHHDGKPSMAERSAVYRPRGASIISGSVDAHISLQSSGGGVELTLPKGRGLTAKKPFHYDMLDVPPPSGAPSPGVKLQLRDETPELLSAKILSAIQQSDLPVPNKVLTSLFNVAGDELYNILRSLERVGAIRRSGRGAWEAT